MIDLSTVCAILNHDIERARKEREYAIDHEDWDTCSLMGTVADWLESARDKIEKDAGCGL